MSGTLVRSQVSVQSVAKWSQHVEGAMVGAMRATEWALAVLFPPLCIGCDRRSIQPGFCYRCHDEVARRSADRCARCGRAFSSGGDHKCSVCIDHPPAFERLWACSTYSRNRPDAPLARAIRRLKYDRDVSFAKPLASLLIERFGEDFAYDAIVPVPLHLSRLRWRGFNQAVVLGRPLSAQRVCPMHTLALERVRPTPPQVGLGGEERRRNMANAFRVRPEWGLSGKRVLLVDDIYTTGATVDECAKVLRRAGARAVDVAVLARAM